MCGQEWGRAWPSVTLLGKADIDSCYTLHMICEQFSFLQLTLVDLELVRLVAANYLLILWTSHTPLLPRSFIPPLVLTHWIFEALKAAAGDCDIVMLQHCIMQDIWLAFHICRKFIRKKIWNSQVRNLTWVSHARKVVPNIIVLRSVQEKQHE